MFSSALRKQAPFARFFVGFTISAIGDWLNVVAVSVLVFQLTGQISKVAIVLMCASVASVVITPYAGVLADCIELRKLIIGLDLYRASVALLPLMAHSAGSVWFVYIAMMGLQAGSCFNMPAEGAYVPNLISDKALLGAMNGALSTARGASVFVGPACGAWLVATGGTHVAFLVNAASFVVAAILVCTLPRVPHANEEVPGFHDLAASYGPIVRGYPYLWPVFVARFFCGMTIAYFQTIMVIYAYSLGQAIAFVGVLYLFAGLGDVIGGVFYSLVKWQDRYGLPLLIFACSLPFVTALSWVRWADLALVLVVLSTWTETIGDIKIGSLLQTTVDEHERGRAWALFFEHIFLGRLFGACFGIGVPLIAGSNALSVGALGWLGLGGTPIVFGMVWWSIRVNSRTAPPPAEQDAQPEPAALEAS